MSGLQLMCPICTETFQESDEIHSTTCGHIYHLACMREWQSRDPSCPQCRHKNPSTHKLYLVLNEEEPTAPIDNVEDLKTKLDSSLDKIRELGAQVQEEELNFLQLQKQFTSEQKLRKLLQRKIEELTNSDENFLRLHALYSESEDRVKLLREENEKLLIANDNKCANLTQKTNEISALMEAMNVIHTEESNESEAKLLDMRMQFSESESRLRYLEQENKRLNREIMCKSKELTLKEREIYVLKKCGNKKCESAGSGAQNTTDLKLKHVTGELEKEIANSTKLLVDNIKLQKQIKQMELQNRQTKK